MPVIVSTIIVVEIGPEYSLFRTPSYIAAEILDPFPATTIALQLVPIPVGVQEFPPSYEMSTLPG